MYLPKEIPNAKVLITVKTYPRPTPSYEEIVCTAGILESGEWIRIYPIPFRELPYAQQFSKFNWIELNLVKEENDFRIESYKPRMMFDEQIVTLQKLGTKSQWLERKRITLKEVFDSMSQLISLAHKEGKSLATLKPEEIIDLVVEEEIEREWDDKYTSRLNQMKLFEIPGINDEKRSIVRKLPYRYYYRFLTKGDKSPRKMRILDWEIGALYWNCLRSANGDEFEANELVKQRYFNEFVATRDLYYFLGTTYQFHKKRVENPFTIIGVFAPPKTNQLALDI